MEKFILEATTKHVEDKKVFRSSQHRLFTKGKLCIIDPIAFYGGTTSWIDEGRAVDVACHDFSKTLDIVSHDILICMNWLNGKSQSCNQWH